MKQIRIVFAGDYDIASKERFRAALEPVSAVPTLVLDFEEVTYIDSTIISELVRLHKIRTEKHLDRETIIVTSRRLRKLFDMLRLDEVFRLVGSKDEAFYGNGVTAGIVYAFTAAESTAVYDDEIGRAG